MVKLRLRRRGRKFHAFYDIVAIDSRSRRDGAFIERVGYFNPNDEVSKVTLDHSKAIYWLNNGAQPTAIVNSLLSADGVLLRRHLGFKGKPEAEIEELVAKHKENTVKRYLKQKEVKRKRREAKAKAEAAAKAAAENA